MSDKRQVETMVPYLGDRNIDPRMAGAFARALEASGVVDYMQTWDQLTSWWPQSVWTPANTPRAATGMADPDSFADPFILAGIGAASTESLGVGVSTDAIRRGPAELMQSMLTLGHAARGRAALMIGAGELKQAKPFGYKRSEGLSRLEDHFRLYRQLIEAKEPFDFEGNHWTLSKGWIGSAAPFPLRIWGMGGGPQFLKMTAKYADGLSTAIPCAFSTPDQFASMVANLKVDLEKAGRDPEDFDFAVWAMSLVHEDPHVIDRAFDNPLVRWVSAAFGRLHSDDWHKEGIEPAFPPGFHYALKMLPAQATVADVEHISSRVSDEMNRRSWFHGSPKEVAASLREYVDAGATCVTVLDFMPLLLGPEEDEKYLIRQLECARLLKA
ncbi:LLM class flavin-dependent oxidoreductase [Gordonia sp. KTR9]|uniref:LLM class flavin-dependent oxidoreductase n=1 Tax=Gordonia sp. KTR9 TaxID=337191 RepID=UPI00027DDC20|nr:LLM class flavin-dependent oxidoreductase [Gordonia sp. KTR9]AFR48211.1 Coenzyme F420-dependent N5,N10-methylene tetrahydromethanopterin reductase-related flavin- dependent oxidoreductase [Gordonia sp. KTR9]